MAQLLQRQLLRQVSQARRTLPFVRTQMRFFSNGEDPRERRTEGRDAFDQKEREKVNKAPDMDEKDETSFQDKFMFVKVGFYSVLVFGSLILINNYMTNLVKQRQARLNGEPEVLTEKDRHKLRWSRVAFLIHTYYTLGAGKQDNGGPARRKSRVLMFFLRPAFLCMSLAINSCDYGLTEVLDSKLASYILTLQVLNMTRDTNLQNSKTRIHYAELQICSVPRVSHTEKDKINKVGGNWVLKDLNGNTFGSANLNGTYYLLYFGFSLCPDVCPISMMKLTKAIRKIKKSKEGQQYYKVKGVFVTVNPEMDTPSKLKEFCDMFDKEDLIPLRENSNQAFNLLNMLSEFKVPVGLNDDEREKIKAYFDRKKEKEGRFARLKFWKRRQEFDPLEGMMNDHSRVFYLMGADNRFLAFYPLDIDETELAQNVIEDISYDMGNKYIGSGNRPPTNMNFNK